jgi:RimJ/RimL family protein N-acetyltransferase
MADVFLRAMELEDLDRVHKWHNDAELYTSLAGLYRFVSRSTVEEWIRKKQVFSQDAIHLAICATEDGEHIGNIYLRDIDWVSRHGEIHIFIGERGRRSKGYGRQALELLKDYAFRDMGLHRLWLRVMDDNAGAIRMYEKCGFVLEGRMRKQVFKNGDYRDILIMGVCVDDPKPAVESA